jgi:UDP-N-acetylglucosamine--N-acetylmuramyl-(pentapeptide) pyrophosphoryl-undecaprenol N-acetylglucosamine transferase
MRGLRPMSPRTTTVARMTVSGQRSIARRPLAVAVGPTRGHVYPAWATAEAYRAAGGLDLLVIDTPLRLAETLLPAGDWRHAPVPGSPLVGVRLGGAVAGLLGALRGASRVRRILSAHGTRLVIGFGSYAAGSAVLAARSLGLTAVIHEANAVPGLANRLLAPFAHRVYLAFPSAGSGFRRDRCRVVGHPVRSGIRTLAREERLPPAARRPARVLVSGGGAGSRFLARAAPELLARVVGTGPALEVLHEVGAESIGPVLDAYAAAGIHANVVPGVTDMTCAYRWADFAITRAGAGTIAELGVLGLPALLVPLSTAAGDHQTANAVAAASAGGTWWVSEREWQADLLAPRLGRLLRDPEAWTQASARARGWIAPDAAERLVADCELLMRGRW